MKYIKCLVFLFTLMFIFNFSVSAKAKLPEGISWFKGSVEDAFKEGKKQNKPLFLYWGAVWCPPCNHIKNNIFSKDLFKKAIADFIPVYLDGDEPRAQLWSDKLGAKGYPTMLIYTPGGKEAMRIPWDGITVEKYASLLESALNEMKPIEELYKNALKGNLSDDEWHLIACYSWDQDYTLNLEDQPKKEALEAFYKKIPSSLDLDKSRLFFHYVNALSSSKTELSTMQQMELAYMLKKILKSSRLVRANVETLAYSAEDVLMFLFPKDHAKLAQYAALWGKAMKAVENDKSFTVYERVSGMSTQLYLFDILNKDQAYPDAMKEHVKARAYWASLEADNPYAREAVMSTAIYFLRKTKQWDVAKKMALAELSISKTPYYYMSTLSRIALSTDKKQEAIDWLRKGWKSAGGSATKFQWATSYLTGIMQHAPEDKMQIRSSFITIFTELVGDEDAFSGRKMSRLDRIERAMKSWNKDNVHQTFVTGLKQDLSVICNSSPTQDVCKQWVEKL